MPSQFEREMGFNPQAPLVVMEGRAPLPGQQVTRQTYLPQGLRRQGVQLVYIQAQSAATYRNGLIGSYTVYQGATYKRDSGWQAPAWRLRDLVWADGDMPAFLPEWGYNSPRFRRELATRLGLDAVLSELGLSEQAVRSTALTAVGMSGEVKEDFTFVKPNAVSDVAHDLARRAQLVRRLAWPRELTPNDDLVVQSIEPSMMIEALLRRLGASTQRELRPDCFHALRVYQPLWCYPDQPVAAELRLSHFEDVGQLFATELHLLEPAVVFAALPQLAELHQRLWAALRGRYGELNYPGIDYIVGPDASVRVLNILPRPLTPNLEGQPAEVAHLARATADVEAEKLAELAWLSYQQGNRPLM